MTRIGGPDLLGAARALALDSKLDKKETELILGLAAEGGVTAAQRRDLLDILSRHKDELTSDARASLAGFLGLDVGPDTAIASLGDRLAADGALSASDAVRLIARVRADGVVTAEERQALEVTLQRPELSPQAANLLRGVLDGLPGDADALPTARPGALAQVVALRSKGMARARRLGVDPDKTRLRDVRLRELLGDTSGEGHLLVALGAATPEQRAALQGEGMTLRAFYDLAATGHFGADADKPTT